MWQHLTLTRKLGEGGMGEVWLAYDSRYGAQYAVKKLKPELFREKDLVRFRREIEILKAAPHPNVVKIVDVAQEGEEPGFCLEYCPDGDLETAASRAKGNIETSMEYFWQVVEAIDHLHSRERPIVHRDIKPSNILIGADGRLKVSDFGLSRFVDETTRVTSSNWYSPGFSSPEQYEDFASADERSDIYSVGCTLHFLLTGSLYRPSVHLESISDPALRYMLDSMLRRRPEERFASAAKIRQAWKALSEGVLVEEFIDLPKDQKLAKIQKIGHVRYGEPGDIERCMDAVTFLEPVIAAERDPDVVEAAKDMLSVVEETERFIIEEMKQENPP